MRQFEAWVAVALGWGLLVSPALAGVKGEARVESVEGAQTALLQKGVELREAAPGEVIRPGEHVRTDSKTKVIVAYADGSKLVIQPNTDLEVGDNRLHGGTVQGKVTKSQDAPAGKIKFMIRTKVAVMGVRGTEFVAAFNSLSNISQFNTLEGLVEVASDPVSLLGGGGTPVNAGKFVQATEAGVGELKSFNRTEFLEGLKTGASSVGGSASSASSSLPLMTSVSSAAQVTSVVSSGRTSSTAPPAAPPPRLPDQPKPPETPQQVKEKAAAAERERPKFHPLAFSLGGFFARSKRLANGEIFRAVHIAWTPSFPLPFADFLVLRGSFGGSLFQNGSLNNKFLIREFQGFLSFQLLKPLFVEAGWGRQVWASEDVAGHIFTANTGLILSENGRWNRVFVGVSHFTGDKDPTQVRAGVGIQF